LTDSLCLAAIIFDMDGTLADTLPVLFAAFRRAFSEHGRIDFSDEQIEAMFGRNEQGILRAHLPRYDDTVYGTFLEEYERSHGLASAPFEGMVEVIQMLRSRNVRVGLVTGKGDGSAEISLRKLGLAALLDAVATGSAQERIKAGCITQMVRDWGLQPSQAAYVGDADTDVIDAREAGVLAVSAAWAGTANLERLRSMQPDALFTNTRDLRSWLEAHVCGAD
jgi:pyrophosphatase PpaX